MKCIASQSKTKTEALKEETVKNTVRWFSIAVAFVLADKFGLSPTKIKAILKSVEYQADSIVKDYVNIEDLRDTLDKEYGIHIS